jgi:hypothetical protein
MPTQKFETLYKYLMVLEIIICRRIHKTLKCYVTYIIIAELAIFAQILLQTYNDRYKPC